MNILFIHQNFPGQFRHLAPALIERGHSLTALTPSPQAIDPRIRVVRYSITRGNGRNTHPWAIDTESKIIRGQALLAAARELAAGGYIPELIIAHPGWGESLFVKEVWPDARLLTYCEYYYASPDSELGYDPEFPASESDRCRAILKNLTNLLALEQMDHGISPTRWQRDTYPERVRERITIAHEGVDTARVAPNEDAWIQLASVRLTRAHEVVSFVARNLEPTRGFHVFMRALPDLLKKRPNAHVLIVGGDAVSYGTGPSAGLTWRAKLRAELGNTIDQERVHFLGRLPYAHYLSVLQVASVHVYLSYPFVLSWSLLEAMACACPIVACDSAPVREVLEDGKEALLTDFFDRQALVDKMTTLLEDRALATRLGRAARSRTVQEFDLSTVCLPRQLALVDEMLRR